MNLSGSRLRRPPCLPECLGVDFIALSSFILPFPPLGVVGRLVSGAPCLPLSLSRSLSLVLERCAFSVVLLPLRTIITCVTSGFLCLFFMTGSGRTQKRERGGQRQRERGGRRTKALSGDEFISVTMHSRVRPLRTLAARQTRPTLRLLSEEPSSPLVRFPRFH